MTPLKSSFFRPLNILIKGHLNMTSQKFSLVQIDAVIVRREARQRQELTRIDELADSISRLGLINPITINEDMVLIAGERRLTACKQLGWSHIPVQFADVEADSRAIELEENIKRVDMTWQDQAKATSEYHALQAELNPNWTQEDSAAALGISKTHITNSLQLSEELQDPESKVAKAPRRAAAINLIARKRERRKADILNDIFTDINTKQEKLETKDEDGDNISSPPQSPVVNANFTEWLAEYSGAPFNFLHCDFPYGVGMHKSAMGSAWKGSYEDTPDVYWNLVRALCEDVDKILAPSAHIIFWLSMEYFTETLDYFHSHTDISFSRFPLVWHKTDNRGIMPDPSRGPRRIYETAIFGSRGDRKVVQPVANCYGAPTGKHNAAHQSEKPEPVLNHFFRMVVDTNTRMLDPTCGAGSALRSARNHGAFQVLGIELNPEYAEQATRLYQNAEALR